MNSSQMKNEGDPKVGETDYLNLDTFNKVKYSGSIWRERGTFDSQNRLLRVP